jgi:voltage-dependent potassium channel beta subunit
MTATLRKDASMHYNKLGKAGLRLSEISLGSWITFGKQIDLKEIKQLMHTAFDHGVNFFDNAESYAHGEAEILMGKAAKEFRREDLVLSTKIFWGGNGPNDTGLSRKHLLEGTYHSLRRMQLNYVDLLFCHRPDPNTPLEETVLAMDYLVRQGYVLYWGTSEWTAQQLEEAYTIATELNCIKPSMEQPKYNLFFREHLEKDYLSLFAKYGMGTTTWSPLASGILSGKYNLGVPADSRLAKEGWLVPDNFMQLIEKTKKLAVLAQELECKLAQLAIAWCLKNPHVSSVITGATKLEQLQENLGALDVKAKLTPAIMQKIDSLLQD